MCFSTRTGSRCPWNEGTCAGAARNRHLDCLVYAQHERVSVVRVYVLVSGEGAGTSTVFVPSTRTGVRGTTLRASTRRQKDTSTTSSEYAHNNECPWDEDTCFEAAAQGHLDVLKWAREHGCPWYKDVCTNKAETAGHLDVLDWICLIGLMVKSLAKLYSILFIGNSDPNREKFLRHMPHGAGGPPPGLGRTPPLTPVTR